VGVPVKFLQPNLCGIRLIDALPLFKFVGEHFAGD